MNDINQTTLREPDPIAWEEFNPGGGSTFKGLPPKGEYVLTPTKAEKGATKDGYLQFTITATVAAPGQPYDGYELRYWRVNTKKWPQRASNGILDYLAAHGIAQQPRTNEEYEQLVALTIGRPFRAMLDWEAYDSATQTRIRGMENFKDAEGGGKQSWVDHPTGRLDAQGRKERLYANVVVRYPISALTPQVG